MRRIIRLVPALLLLLAALAGCGDGVTASGVGPCRDALERQYKASVINPEAAIGRPDECRDLDRATVDRLVQEVIEEQANND